MDLHSTEQMMKKEAAEETDADTAEETEATEETK